MRYVDLNTQVDPRSPSLGKVYATPEALEAISAANEKPVSLLVRHLLCEFEVHFRSEDSILSAHLWGCGVELLIDTHLDGGITTIDLSL